MKKTTFTFTALPHRVAGTAGMDGKLQLSVFIAPRLWTTEPAEQTQILHLNDFPLLGDWPAQVGAMQFDVTFAGSPPLAAAPVSAGALRSDLWAALFPPTTPVKPFRFDNLANTPIQTIDTAYLEGWLRDLYRRVGADPAYGAGANNPSTEAIQNDPGLAEIARPSQPEPPYEPPAKRRVPIHYKPEEPEKGGCLKWLIAAINWLAGKLGLGQPFQIPAPASAPVPPSPSEKGGHPTLSHLQDESEGAGAPLPAPGGGGGSGVRSASSAKAKFDEAVAFVQPFEPTTVIPPPLTDEQLADLLDFHDGVALAADYPTLLRALGLVVDLEVDWPAGLPAIGTVSIKVSPLSGAFLYPLRTHYTLAGGHFLPAPRPVNTGLTESRDGLLRLSDESRYRIVQTDVVGAAVKAQNMATSVAALGIPGLQPANPPAEASLPALRSAGLAVVQGDLASQLLATYVQAVGLQNALAAADGSPQESLNLHPQPLVPTDELWAEDVTRGYRMDVRDLNSTSKKWRSLHQRTGRCVFTRPTPDIGFPIEDEGYVQIGTTEPATDGVEKVQRVPDIIATWTGWSLNAVRPGKALVESDKPGEAAQEVPGQAKTTFKMDAAFKPVSGSLPRLRFGHRYQVRVRTVDLAGNSVFGPDDPEFQQAHPDDTPPRAYRRFEPVPSPAVVLKAQPIEGESVERLVLRSGAQAGDPQHVNRKETERHIVPPKSSQLLAEHHSQFDTDGQPHPDQATYDRAAREANTLSHHWAQLSGGKWALIPLPGVETLPDADDKKDPTFWQTKDVFPLAYLPDPLARQVVFGNLPGPAENVVTHIPLNGEWPDRLPFRLKLKAIPAGQTSKTPQWTAEPANPTTRVLEVELAEGESRIVRLNSGTDENDLAQMGVWGWETEPKTANYNHIAADAAQGLNWLLMPYRELHLVHATQKPLEKPVLHITKIEKVEGDTTAAITGAAAVHGKTTGKVDLLALWTDPEDDIGKDAPGERKSRAALGEFNVTAPEITSVPIAARHNLGDTRYHRVTYVARGSTRFREYMPAVLLAQPNVDDLLGTPTEAEIAAGNLSTVAVEDVLNSARPLAPAVAYVMPTLGRVQESVADTGKEKIFTRKRPGNGLRVFVQRPWYSSGAGELLGVVFQKQGSFTTLSEALRPYVTEWANDPIWASPTADLTPSAANFTNTAAGPLDVKLEETGELVRVVGYPVEYDADRGLWYADVEFAGLNAYTPMARLALARFQPKSVDDCFISRVVRTDFIQPLPDRTLVIQQMKSGLPQLTVTLTGLAPTLAAGQTRPVQAWIEKLEVPAQGDLGWKPVGAETVQLAPGEAEGLVLWKGTFYFTGLLPPNAQYRLVIQEMEAVYPATFETPEEAAAPSAGTPGRTVYADMWAL